MSVQRKCVKMTIMIWEPSRTHQKKQYLMFLGLTNMPGGLIRTSRVLQKFHLYRMAYNLENSCVLLSYLSSLVPSSFSIKHIHHLQCDSAGRINSDFRVSLLQCHKIYTSIWIIDVLNWDLIKHDEYLTDWSERSACRRI